MTRKSARSNRHKRPARWIKGAGMALIVLGVVLLLTPYLCEALSIGPAPEWLAAPGWLMPPAGVALLLLAGRKRRRPAAPAPRGRAAPADFSAQASRFLDDAVSTQAGLAPAPDRWSRAVFDAIEWRRFEVVVERLFRQAGFETRSHSRGADVGMDIWLYSRHEPNQPVSVVQCKHWHDGLIGVEKVRELHGAMAARKVRRGQFAATSAFTREAVVFARENGINLLDAQGLLTLIGRRSAQEQAELLAVALDGEYWRPTCGNCGVKMLARRPRAGGPPFWGCPNAPRCTRTMPMLSSA
jgi:restriction system protein